jgi:long-subunit acyl-CoA synthetase (AMP-forming)
MYYRNYVQKMIAQFAEDDQNRTALMLYDGKQVTEIGYRCLAERILRAANYFKNNGLTQRHIALALKKRDGLTAAPTLTGLWSRLSCMPIGTSSPSSRQVDIVEWRIRMTILSSL